MSHHQNDVFDFHGHVTDHVQHTGGNSHQYAATTGRRRGLRLDTVSYLRKTNLADSFVDWRHTLLFRM